MIRNHPVCKDMCPTCPFRKGSPHSYLARDLAHSARELGSRICHSTGSNAINRRTGKREHICRGARDIQLNYLHRLGAITAATDEAFNAERVRRGWQPQEIKNP